jgi:hypothetical protein
VIRVAQSTPRGLRKKRRGGTSAAPERLVSSSTGYRIKLHPCSNGLCRFCAINTRSGSARKLGELTMQSRRPPHTIPQTRTPCQPLFHIFFITAVRLSAVRLFRRARWGWQSISTNFMQNSPERATFISAGQGALPRSPAKRPPRKSSPVRAASAQPGARRLDVALSGLVFIPHPYTGCCPVLVNVALSGLWLMFMGRCPGMI